MPWHWISDPHDFGGDSPDNDLPGGGYGGGHPGNRPPGSGGGHPGNRPPGSGNRPNPPGFGGGWGSGDHPGNRPPQGGAHPGNRPPGSWGGGRPDNDLPGGGWGGGGDTLPEPPPGIWPPPSQHHPWVKVPEDQAGTLKPGMVFPALPEAAKGQFVVLAMVPGHGTHYVVIDASLKPPKTDNELPAEGEGEGGAPAPKPGAPAPAPAQTGRRG